jgi:hypothetical protein
VQVCTATPVGLLLGALVPRMLNIQPSDTNLRKNMDALMPVHAAIASAAFMAAVYLMRQATNSLKRDVKAAAAQQGPKQATAPASNPSQISDGATSQSQRGHHPSEQGSFVDTEDSDLEEPEYDSVASMDLLRQIAKLARTAEYVCFAVAFACFVAPLLLLWALQDLQRPTGYLGTTDGAAIFAVSLLLSALL